MTPEEPWETPFRNGMEELRMRNFDEALKSFDEAVEAAGDVARIFKSRTEVLLELKTLDMSIRLDGSPHAWAKMDEENAAAGGEEGYERRLWSLLARLPSTFQSCALAIHCKNQPPGVSSHYMHIAEARQRLLQQSRNLTSYLPPELLLLIGRSVVRSSSPWSAGKGFALAEVCKRWRSVFIQDKELWEDVKIRGTSSSALEKAETLLARGRLRFLSVWLTQEGENISDVYRLLEGKGSDLRLLQASLGKGTGLDDIWRILFGASGPPHLTSLRVICWNEPFFLLYLPPTFIPTLKHLEIRSLRFEWETSLLPLLLLLPNLETIVLDGGDSLRLVIPTTDETNLLELPSLTSISITEYSGQPLLDSSSYLVAPLLNKLDLTECEHQSHHNFLFPPSPHLPNTTHLTTLILGDSQSLPEWNELDLLADLKHMPSLTYLSVENSTISDAFIDGLQRDGDEEKVLCPLLSSLHLGDSDVRWEAVERMVRARWDADDDGKDRRGIRRITYRRPPGHPYLKGDEVDWQAYEWLKNCVEEFENYWEAMDDDFDDDDDA